MIDNAEQEMVMVNGALAELARLSVAVTVNVYVPAALGVPVIAPPADIDRPVGNDPLVMENEYGVEPLWAEIWTE